MPKLRRDPVAEMLGTSNKKEQVAAIQQLLQLAQAPVLTIAVTFDARTSRVDAKQIGGQAPNELVQQILDGAKNLFNQQEVAKQIELAKQDVPEETTGEDTPEGIPDLPPTDPEGEQDAE